MRRHWLDSVLARINVHTASLLVPHADRPGWTREWTAELHHLCHAPEDEVVDSADADPLEFSFGAYHDAFWIRCDRLRSDGLPRLQSGSAARCGLLLATAACAALLICLALPGARNALLLLPYRNSSDLVIISSRGYAGAQSPSIAVGDYQEWTTDTANLYTQIAFYRPTIKGVYLADHEAARLSVAQASDNLLQLLDLPIARIAPADPHRGESRLVLSHNAWLAHYHGDPQIVGRTADIDGRRVWIAGILPDADWRLPGKVDALLLEDPEALAALPSQTRGFVVARIRNSAFPPPRGGWRKMIETRHGVTRGFDCISVRHLLGQPFVFLFALLLASLALPATTALPLGDYPHRRDHLPATVNARRWIFLLAKFALVIVIVDLCSTDLAYGFYSSDPVTALYIQLATAFPALLFGFRWILQDQRKRCPECLRLLSNPARVGQASCNFLSWNGTELFCARGHGLLHIPEMPTSWFSTQRWLCLDSSWRSLFPEGCSPSPGMV